MAKLPIYLQEIPRLPYYFTSDTGYSIVQKSPYLCILSSTASAAPAYQKSVEIQNLGKFSNGKFIGHSDNQVTAR
jgi:hypothetical protein